MGCGEEAALPADFSPSEGRLSDEQLAELRVWALQMAAHLPPGRARMLLFLLNVTEETGTVWNRIPKADLSSGTGLSRSHVKRVLKALAEERVALARPTEGPGGSHGVNEYALSLGASGKKKNGGGQRRPAAAKKARRPEGSAPTLSGAL